MATRREKISEAANIYGEKSFDNYAQTRSIAEQIREGFCAYLDPDKDCVFLVPPQGAFTAQNYRSAAYSVSGKGFLPLEPISFGLAVRISEDSDFMRVVLTCRKEGEKVFVYVEQDQAHTLELPVTEKGLEGLYETLYLYFLNWFKDRVHTYDNGDYSSNDIGFNIYRVDED